VCRIAPPVEPVFTARMLKSMAAMRRYRLNRFNKFTLVFVMYRPMIDNAEVAISPIKKKSAIFS
jgi:hypothetical protein